MTYRDRTQDATVSTGTGTLSLAGTAPAGLRTFSEVFSVNQTGIDYCIFDSTAWEIGRGTFLTGNAFSRDTVLSSSNANAAVSFSAGTKTVMHILSAAALVDLQANRPQNATAISSGVTLATDTVALVVDGVLKVMTVENFIALVTVPSGSITDSTAVGRAVLTAADAPAQRTALGLGTAATQSSAAFDAAGAAAAAQAASQPIDADLMAIAALSTTAFGRSLLTGVDAPATRTTIGAGTSDLAIGTTSITAKAGDYQPAAANISDATAAGRSVLTAADAPAQRTALGLGTAATTAAADYATAAQGATADTALQPGAVHAATSKATPVDADEIPLQDSADSYGLKKLTWANLKATAKTYFDTLYGTVKATAGNLTANALVLGAGATDTKVSTGITSDGASQLNLGVSATTAGKLKLFGSTSGDATLKTAAAAGTAVQITLPVVDATLATLGANGFTANQTITGNCRISGASYVHDTYNTGTQSSADGYFLYLSNRYSANAVYVGDGTLVAVYLRGIYKTSAAPALTIQEVDTSNVVNNSADAYISGSAGADTGSNRDSARIFIRLRSGNNSTLSNTNGGRGGALDIRLGNGGAGNGTGVQGTKGYFAVRNVSDSALMTVSYDGISTFAGNITISANGLTTTPVPVATLPTASAYAGTRCYVNDATMTILAGNGTTVAGGGGNTVPVGSNGTNWIIGG